MATKQVCCNISCGWVGSSDDVFRATNPFNPKGKELWGCPKCKEVNSLVLACDEPGCCSPGVNGYSTAAGWRVTCPEHTPARK